MCLLSNLHEDSSLSTIEMMLAKKIIINNNAIPPNIEKYPSICFNIDNKIDDFMEIYEWLDTPIKIEEYEYIVNLFSIEPIQRFKNLGLI